MWRDLSRSIQADATLPDIVGERCVHALAEQASCRACVDVCPRDAWVIDEDMLGIDSDLCDGCGVCVPACPQGVIEPRFSPTVRRSGDKGAAFVRCEHSDVVGTNEGLVPCLHSLDTIGLIELSRSDVEYIVASSGDCDSCLRGKVVGLGQRVEEVNRLLSAREMKPLKYRNIEGNHWIQALRKTSETTGRQRLSRRAFFRKSVEKPREKLKKAIAEGPEKYIPPGVLLPRISGNEPLPFVLDLDTSRCNGCDACVRLCPHQAISLESEDSVATAYHIESEKCSGCGLCLDVCEQNAVTISRWNLVSNDRIPLRVGKCRACGVAFHLPETDQATPPLCRICSHTDHYKNLYQVLD